MYRVSTKHQRRVLHGWIKWAPVLAIPFSILFFHAWLNVEILRADYVLRTLDAEANELAERLSHAGIARTIHEDPEVLAARAGSMNFVPPQPGQWEVIQYDPADIVRLPEDTVFEVARRDTPPSPDSLSREVHTGPEPVPAAPVEAVSARTGAPSPVDALLSLESVDAVLPAVVPAGAAVARPVAVALELEPLSLSPLKLEPLEPLETGLSPLAPAPDDEGDPTMPEAGMGGLESL